MSNRALSKPLSVHTKRSSVSYFYYPVFALQMCLLNFLDNVNSDGFISPLRLIEKLPEVNKYLLHHLLYVLHVTDKNNQVLIKDSVNWLRFIKCQVLADSRFDRVDILSFL